MPNNDNKWFFAFLMVVVVCYTIILIMEIIYYAK